MKNSIVLVLIFSVFFCGIAQMSAQNNSDTRSMSDAKVKKYTVMEQFAPDLVVPANQRLAMKNQRKQDVKRKLAILDTLDISERKKRRLLRDLKNSPFSQRLDKATMVKTEFEDTTDNNK